MQNKAIVKDFEVIEMSGDIKYGISLSFDEVASCNKHIRAAIGFDFEPESPFLRIVSQIKGMRERAVVFDVANKKIETLLRSQSSLVIFLLSNDGDQTYRVVLKNMG